MNPQLEYRRLCRLIDDSLGHLTSSLEQHSDLRISKTCEKQLLISLSQVFKQIEAWTNEFDGDSDDVMEVIIKKSSSELVYCCGNHDCLTKIVGDMILLLSVESRFVQHLAGNILIAISDYFAASESNCTQFVKTLCTCMELGISNALLQSINRPHCSNHDMSHAIIALQPKLKHGTWSLVACVVRVLRTNLKRLKKDIDAELLQIYLNSMSSCLVNVPWDVMDQNWKAIKAISISSDHFEDKGGQLESRSMFHGTLIQLFCSLVNLSECEGADKSLNSHPVISQMINLLPTLLGWCLASGDRNNLRMFEYFRHKILMLMVRLSSLTDLEDSLPFSWLDLIHKYFEDLLLLPMNHPYKEDTLAGSPFISSTRDTNKRAEVPCHLQRLIVLLFLRCSFSLIGLTDKRAKQCVIDSDLTCSRVKKGLSELHWLFQIHLPFGMLEASDRYSERCTSFSISFLRLFIHEDDILFELLLLLFCVPFYAKQKDNQDICSSKEINEDILCRVSNILNPVHLFHLFLAELHYDHQVLLDYLISKDTGASSAEYLLRSLRTVCDSWTRFVEFSLEGEVADMRERIKSSCKKRKILADGSDLWARVGLYTQKGDDVPSSFGNHHQEPILHSDVYSRTYGQPFEKAKDCLLLLENSIKNLHRKELFPYNPKVLLQRLARFQELCSQH